MDTDNKKKGRGPVIAALIIFLAVAAAFGFFLVRFIQNNNFQRAAATEEAAYTRNTPEPTPEPTATPEPTPSATPIPTATPTPTPEPTPTPDPMIYVDPGVFVSDYVYMMRASDQQVACSKNGEDIMYPASMTKVMTVLLTLENTSDLNSPVTVAQEDIDVAFNYGASVAGFEAGETVRVLDLVYAAMLPSGAEACEALSEYVFGSRDEFINKMNEKAAELGMVNTHFSNPTGLHQEDHYSTAKDIALMLLSAMSREDFREIAGTSMWTTISTAEHPDGITFGSSLFLNLETRELPNGAVIEGGKTGTEDLAGKCLCSFASFGNEEYILVTGRAPLEGNEHVQDAVRGYSALSFDSITPPAETPAEEAAPEGEAPAEPAEEQQEAVNAEGEGQTETENTGTQEQTEESSQEETPAEEEPAA